MRSAQEILFRLRQESRNLWMLKFPPTDAQAAISTGLLPPAAPIIAGLASSEFADSIVSIAEQIRLHQIPLLGGVLDAGPQIQWKRDYQRNLETGLGYFRGIPYLDVARAGDHKIIWELNRHQHLVVLAQAYLLTDRDAFLEELAAQIESWMEANPFLRGINWSSALEVAFRSLSWVWVLHLVGDHLEANFAERLSAALYQHGCFIENNLSIYFSPNTHLLGEAVALHALGRLFSRPQWERIGAHWVKREIHRQVRPDGSHFERSSYYHVYALDMFMFHAVLSQRGPEFAATFAHMAEYLAALTGPSQTLPFLGDDDGGRFFHPYGRRNEFARATLATCGVMLGRPEWIGNAGDLLPQAMWWFGPERIAGAPQADPAPLEHTSHLFADAGLAVMRGRDRQVIIDGGRFGPGRAAHSHSDTLSIIVRQGQQEILIDPGTYTYMGDPQWRDWFRGSGAHNTIRVDKRDQATARGPFRWADPPSARIRGWSSTAEHDFFDAECSYRDIVHRRRVFWIKPDLVIIFDEVRGPPGEHIIEQSWLLVSQTAATLVVEGDPQHEEGWRSPVFGEKISMPVIRVVRKQPLPSFLAAAIVFGPQPQPIAISHRQKGDDWRIALEGGIKAEIVMPRAGLPHYRVIE